MVKSSFLWLHKWLGLITGIVVLLVSLTGCIYVFHDDLKVWVYPEKYFISHKTGQRTPKPLNELIKNARSKLGPGEKVSRVDVFPAADRTWIFRAAKTDENAFGHWNYQVYNKRVFVNPYSGEVQSVENSKTEFFQVVLQLHMNLLLGKKIGHPIVGYSTAIFIVLLISGMVLWWPKKWNRKALKPVVWINFKAKWKRLNYDLHNILGFYSLFIALLFCITGLVFAFPDFKKTYVGTLNELGFQKKQDAGKFPQVPRKIDNTLENALFYLLDKYPDADIMSIRLRDSSEALHDIQIRLKKDRTGIFRWYYFNQSDGQISKVNSNEGLLPGDKLASLNFDLHVGSIGGYPTKILVFLISLICSSLPVTGFLVWLNKRKKTSPERKRATPEARASRKPKKQ